LSLSLPTLLSAGFSGSALSKPVDVSSWILGQYGLWINVYFERGKGSLWSKEANSKYLSQELIS
jgi:hypothetical protein